MVKKEDLSAEELKKRFMTLMLDLESSILAQEVDITGEPTKVSLVPKTMQDIPDIFSGWKTRKFMSAFKALDKPPKEYKLDATKTIKIALWIAKKYNLIPRDTPLRQVWYAFIKLALQKSGNIIGNPDQMMSIAFTDIIRDTDLYYSDFNVKNYPYGFKTPDLYEQTVLFPNSLVAMEKSSYYNYLINMADLLGLSIYSAGGQSSLSAAESVAHEIADKFSNSPLDMYTITDYDPSGLDIAANLKEHIGLFLERKGITIGHERVAPRPEHYETAELERALYDASGTNKRRWVTEEMIDERDQYNIPHDKGMEVESLPAQPLPDQMPTGMDIDEAIGQARMRLIIYDVLLEKHGIEHPLRQFLDKYFYTSPEYEAEKIIKDKAGIEDLNNKAWDIYSAVEELGGRFMKTLKDEKEELSDGIAEWRDKEKEEWIADTDEQDNFEDKLRTSVAKDYTQEIFRSRVTFPEIPQTFRDWELANLRKKEKVDKYIKMLDEFIGKINDEIKEYPPEDEE